MKKTQHLSISKTVMLSVEMTREVIRLVLGQDFPWKQADIEAEPITECGWWFQMEKTDPRYPLHQEVERIIRLKCLIGKSGTEETVWSTCRVYNNRKMWEPHWVQVEFNDEEPRRFYFTHFQDFRLVNHIWEGSPIPSQA